MAQQDAQKSEIHETTDDAASSPGNVGRAAGEPRTSGGVPDGGTGRNAPAPARGAPPASNFERGAADRDIELTAEPPGTMTASAAGAGEIGGGPGAGDGSSGGGAGAGIPGGGTDMRTNGAFDAGDPDADRSKLFPETAPAGNPGADAGSPPKGELKATHIESDESDFGGPIKIQADKLAMPPGSG